MNISSLKSYKSLFINSNGDSIDFLALSNENVFFSKTHVRENDFNGNIITKPENEIHTKSIWMVNLKDGMKSEIIQHGDFDINEVYFTDNYLYYLKIIDTDKDGLLLESDYNNGYMWRIHRKTLEQEFCFQVEPYRFHRFLTANDNYIVFISEDRVPDVTEIVFYSIKSKQFSVLNNMYEEDWCDFRIVNNHEGEPDYFIYKIEDNSENELKMISWSELIAQLHWE